ncbi:hypothetical protein V8C42DRAFT_319525 [Trichoderma barbatum]
MMIVRRPSPCLLINRENAWLVMEWLRLRESLSGGVRQCLIWHPPRKRNQNRILRKDEIRQRQEGEEKERKFSWLGRSHPIPASLLLPKGGCSGGPNHRITGTKRAGPLMLLHTSTWSEEGKSTNNGQ